MFLPGETHSEPCPARPRLHSHSPEASGARIHRSWQEQDRAGALVALGPELGAALHVVACGARKNTYTCHSCCATSMCCKRNEREKLTHQLSCYINKRNIYSIKKNERKQGGFSHNKPQIGCFCLFVFIFDERSVRYQIMCSIYSRITCSQL